jgi:hypothetical protein
MFRGSHSPANLGLGSVTALFRALRFPTFILPRFPQRDNDVGPVKLLLSHFSHQLEFISKLTRTDELRTD